MSPVSQIVLPPIKTKLGAIIALKLRSTQRAHERIMQNVTYRHHKTASEIRERMVVQDLLTTITRLKLMAMVRSLKANE